MSYSIVIPTVGRPSLRHLLAALITIDGPAPDRIVVVDDRPAGRLTDVMAAPAGTLVLASGGGGPATARNVGWRAVDSDWVVFLDDDVLPGPRWAELLAGDLQSAASKAGSQGRILVPLPEGRRPTDWERSTAALENARWATADMAYRRRVLVELGGFDERFRRAYREDAEFALRVLDAGYELARGRREIVHPVRPAPFFVSVGAQRGNADDALIRRLHGASWRERAQAPSGRFARHVAIVAAGLGAALARAGARHCAASASQMRRRWSQVAAAASLASAGACIAGMAELAAARVQPGPKAAGELLKMTVTSIFIPPAAVWHRLCGEVAALGARPVPRRPVRAVLGRAGRPAPTRPAPPLPVGWDPGAGRSEPA
jgi:Glycosyl transferase family 2